MRTHKQWDSLLTATENWIIESLQLEETLMIESNHNLNLALNHVPKSLIYVSFLKTDLWESKLTCHQLGVRQKQHLCVQGTKMLAQVPAKKRKTVFILGICNQISVKNLFRNSMERNLNYLHNGHLLCRIERRKNRGFFVSHLKQMQREGSWYT